MKIESSNVQMQSQTTKTVAVKVSLIKGQAVVSGDFLRDNDLAIGQNQGVNDEAFIDLSEAAKKAQDELTRQNKEQSQAGLKNMAAQMLRRPEQTTEFQGFRSIDYRLDLLRWFMRQLTGKDFRFLEDLERLTTRSTNSQQSSGSMSLKEGSPAAAAERPALVSFESLTVEYYESESVSFRANASVTTEDGRSMNIEIGLNMSRELYQRLDIGTISVGELNLCDPLVINFGTATAGLSDQKITFDLDCDGESDQISALLSGSGFLAVDNGEGIKDGSQLFGTQSGNGFADLAQYDSDGNGWIDENDDIWDKLRIWVTDGDGQRLIALGEVGIGAIFLGNVSTNYTLEGQSGDTQGMLRQTGFFLREDGTAGTVQHVDLKI